MVQFLYNNCNITTKWIFLERVERKWKGIQRNCTIYLRLILDTYFITEDIAMEGFNLEICSLHLTLPFVTTWFIIQTSWSNENDFSMYVIWWLFRKSNSLLFFTINENKNVLLIGYYGKFNLDNKNVNCLSNHPKLCY